MISLRSAASTWSLLALLAGLSGTQGTAQTQTYAPGKFPTFTFSELTSLSKSAPLPEVTAKKLNVVLNSVVLDNTESTTAASIEHGGAPAIRVAEWNIERGENYDWVVRALKGDKNFRSALQKDNPQLSPAQINKAVEESQLLSKASVLVLNEVDLGMTRSDYHDVARELSEALKMNYVYGVEFVEVDPMKLGTEELTDADVGGDQELRTELESELKADPARYKGYHGSAILSRYPINNVRLLRLPDCYDWFQQEIDSVSKVEAGKRLASDKIFLEKIEREIRRGGRIAIIADLSVPQAPGESGQAHGGRRRVVHV